MQLRAQQQSHRLLFIVDPVMGDDGVLYKGTGQSITSVPRHGHPVGFLGCCLLGLLAVWLQYLRAMK